MSRVPLERVDECIWRIPKHRPDMRVPVLIFASEELLGKMKEDRTLWQAANVSTLPGIVKHVAVLPDAHEGYGFPIGGVAATDYEEGVITPGGIGFDINCGVRLMVTNLDVKDVKPRLNELIETIFRNVPCGLGSRRKDFRVTKSELDRISVEGARYIIEKFGLGWPEDLKHIEEEGCLEGADPSYVSATAKQRGFPQIGTLGSGNHFLEVQKVDKIFDERAAKRMGITHEGQVTVMIHTGSRGFGHQICSDYLRVMERAAAKYGIKLPDRELACAPAKSKEAESYLKAFRCAVNFAFANRQAITHWVRQSFEQVFKRPAETMDLRLIYDVAHNIVKLEEHVIDGVKRKLWVHRKGATRSFPAGHPLVPQDYRDIGQPVILPGSMGTSSWLLLGNERAMEMTFGSTAHGAGRMMSRAAAKRKFRASQVIDQLHRKGIVIRSDSMRTVAEEVDAAYKNVDIVAEVSDRVGIGTKVARLLPLGVVKG